MCNTLWEVAQLCLGTLGESFSKQTSGGHGDVGLVSIPSDSGTAGIYKTGGDKSEDAVPLVIMEGNP